MKQFNYFMPFYAHYSGSSIEGKDEHPTPSENGFSFEETEKSQLFKKIQYLQQRCQYLEVQNEGLRDDLRKQNKVQIKIEVFEKNSSPSREALDLALSIPVAKKGGEKVPKRRRTEKELVKNFNCPYSGCKKDYASALALNLHMRVKHGGGTKKERKQLLKNIIDAQLKGQQLPQISLNLPPNYLQQKKKLILFCEEFHKADPAKNQS